MQLQHSNTHNKVGMLVSEQSYHNPNYLGQY